MRCVTVRNARSVHHRIEEHIVFLNRPARASASGFAGDAERSQARPDGVLAPADAGARRWRVWVDEVKRVISRINDSNRFAATQEQAMLAICQSASRGVTSVRAQTNAGQAVDLARAGRQRLEHTARKLESQVTALCDRPLLLSSVASMAVQ